MWIFAWYRTFLICSIECSIDLPGSTRGCLSQDVCGYVEVWGWEVVCVSVCSWTECAWIGEISSSISALIISHPATSSVSRPFLNPGSCPSHKVKQPGCLLQRCALAFINGRTGSQSLSKPFPILLLLLLLRHHSPPSRENNVGVEQAGTCSPRCSVLGCLTCHVLCYLPVPPFLSSFTSSFPFAPQVNVSRDGWISSMASQLCHFKKKKKNLRHIVL